MAALVQGCQAAGEHSRRSALRGRMRSAIPPRKTWPHSRWNSTEPKLRAAGRAVKARLEPAAVLKELPALLKDEKVSVVEKQGAFAILARQRSSEETDKLLNAWLDKAMAGKVRAGDHSRPARSSRDPCKNERLRLYAAAQAKGGTIPLCKIGSVRRSTCAVSRVAQRRRRRRRAKHLPQQLGGLLPALSQARWAGRRGRSAAQRCRRRQGEGPPLPARISRVAQREDRQGIRHGDSAAQRRAAQSPASSKARTRRRSGL